MNAKHTIEGKEDFMYLWPTNYKWFYEDAKLMCTEQPNSMKKEVRFRM